MLSSTLYGASPRETTTAPKKNTGVVAPVPEELVLKAPNEDILNNEAEKIKDEVKYDSGLKGMLARNPYPKPETKEEKEKREKTERLNQTIAGISDFLSSASDLYFATKGAPYVAPKTSMSETVQSKIDQLRKEREANNIAHQKYVTDTILKAEKARDAREEIRRKQKKDEKAAEMADKNYELAKQNAASRKNYYERMTTLKEKSAGKTATKATTSRSAKAPVTYVVDGKTYNTVEEAYSKLPRDVRTKLQRKGSLSSSDKKQAIADYNNDVTRKITWDNI